MADADHPHDYDPHGVIYARRSSAWSHRAHRAPNRDWEVWVVLLTGGAILGLLLYLIVRS